MIHHQRWDGSRPGDGESHLCLQEEEVEEEVVELAAPSQSWEEQVEVLQEEEEEGAEGGRLEEGLALMEAGTERNLCTSVYVKHQNSRGAFRGHRGERSVSTATG